MGAIQKNYAKLLHILEDVEKGTMSHEKLADLLAILKHLEKTLDQALLEASLRLKYGAKAEKLLDAANILGTREAIELNPSRGEERVLCPLLDGGTKSRNECLDYSGVVEHQFQCQRCEIGKITRQILVDGG